MLLIDQVELLRGNLKQLRNQKLSLPLMGGSLATRETYRFMSLVLPARDIATTIVAADPRGDKLPARLRGWNLDTKDEFSNPQKIPLKKLLGMIIHVYYLRIGNGDLDISNDIGKRVILSYDTFLDSVERLVLNPVDTCLVICGLTEEKLKNKCTGEAVTDMISGLGDLKHFLAEIRRWPDLKERIWSMYFADRVSTVKADCQTVNDSPFLMTSRYAGATLLWRMGWRRDDTYAVSWIDLSETMGRIREYFGEA